FAKIWNFAAIKNACDKLKSGGCLKATAAFLRQISIWKKSGPSAWDMSGDAARNALHLRARLYRTPKQADLKKSTYLWCT
ncbi:hypothetical protein LJC48_06945, partial [Desulfovibrio sp. OttesenSCG-928-C06]|nr:hypothetical protein [Desulfovibrio sp. OttesenSCG-928-C06]